MRYASFPPFFLSNFPVFFHTFPRRPFRKRQYASLQAQVHFTRNASTFSLKRRSIFTQTRARFFVQTYISMPQRAENHAKTLLSNKINITFATLLQKTRAYLPGLVHGSGNGEARPERMDCAHRQTKLEIQRRKEI